MIVDCHAHFVPPSLLAAISENAAHFPSVDLLTDDGEIAFAFGGQKPTCPVSKPLQDLEGRIGWLDEVGIDRQICGGWLDMFGYELPSNEGRAWSRLANEHLLDVSRQQPRIVPLATVPLQSGTAAADVLKDAIASGFAGAMIGTQPDGRGGVLDRPDLDAFWRCADDLGATIFIHPVFDSGDSRNDDYGMPNAVGRITDTLISVSRLIYAGHITRYRNVRFVIGTGGAALPYVLGRLKRNYSLDKSLGDPEAALASCYYDTIVHDPRTLRFLAEIVGADRLMLGSDKPFPIGDPTPLDTVAAAGFGADVEAAINGGRAIDVFGLS